jgi:hypothetical protein
MTKYIVHRCGSKNGGTQHWFSHPLLIEEANKLKDKWENENYIPKKEEYDGPLNTSKVSIVLSVSITKYKDLTDFSDGKIRQITVGKRKYFYKTENKERRITTIFNAKRDVIFRYSGDPHDYNRDGVKRIIREKRL